MYKLLLLILLISSTSANASRTKLNNLLDEISDRIGVNFNESFRLKGIRGYVFQKKCELSYDAEKEVLKMTNRFGEDVTIPLAVFDSKATVEKIDSISSDRYKFDYKRHSLTVKTSKKYYSIEIKNDYFADKFYSISMSERGLFYGFSYAARSKYCLFLK